MEGRVQVLLLRQLPALLKYLLGSTSGQQGIKFRKHIRQYNAMFALTSMGGRIDNQINCGKGPFVFRICGQNYHKIGSLFPQIGKKPSFAQLYIYDTKNKIQNRMDSDFRLRLLTSRSQDGRQYNLPTVSEVAGLIVGDFGYDNFERDIIVEHRTKDLQRITDLYPSFMSMTYPLLYPYEEDGYRDKVWTRRKNEKATGRIYFAYSSSGEKFYLRMLLNIVKGLLDDDKEWNDCLAEASPWITGNELR
ncbi:uncharacterized protein [Elaeis guineensis]|uniref:uncharacterized protein n=1 Tax=Elaeis guineensis var. tenera TaxID=51953 RepID=UPI003C6D0540